MPSVRILLRSEKKSMLPIIISAIESPEDRDLMTTFYERHNGLMYHEARKHLDIAEDVEDIVYEAVVRIIDRMDVFRALQPWQRVQYALTTIFTQSDRPHRP